MKKILSLLFVVVMLFTACSNVSLAEETSACSNVSLAKETSAYEKMEAERGRENAVAMVIYDSEAVNLEASYRIRGHYKNIVLILPRYVGSKVRLYSIRATGYDSFDTDGDMEYELVAERDTVIQVFEQDFMRNQMWYLEIETPDGEVYGSPLPESCETDEDTIYIGKDWDEKDRLPSDWGEVDIVETLKPVIYLYPEEPSEVTVKLEYDGELTCTYPKYHDGWNVTAYPDGRITDAQGKEYNYLYWEGLDEKKSDFSTGFCVPGEETAVFLENALEKLGLTRREANEFIVYWLPIMEQNPYNVIAFQTTAYTDIAKLHIYPEPDTMIRVFMSYYASDEPVSIVEQELTAPERTGFTVVEWGGELKVE